MKRIVSHFWFLVAILFPVFASAQLPADLSYSPGDLLMGFRASGGNGADKDYVVKIGSITDFTGKTQAFTVANLGGILTDLNTIFGSAGANDWRSRSNVFWGIAGTTGFFNTIGTDPVKTLYATRAQLVPGTQNASTDRWTRASANVQGPVSQRITGLGNYYATNASDGSPNKSTANNALGRQQATSDTNSYASYQPGSTVTNNAGPAPGISFAYWSSTEANFGSGTANSILELYRIKPSTSPAEAGTPAEFVGTFKLDNNAVLTFTPAPPSGVAIVSIEQATYSVSEADAGGQVAIKLVRGGDLTDTVSASFITANGTALAGTDYTAQSNVTQTFAPNETQKTVLVSIANIAGFQGDRAFTVSLSNPSANAQLGSTSSSTVTIREANASLAFQSATYSVAESDAAQKVTLTVVRGGNTSQTTTVDLTTADGTAVSGTDYAGGTVPLTFNSGDTTKTVDVPVVNRAGAQGNRTFTAGLSNQSASATIIAPTSTTVTITDAVFRGTVSFSSATYSASESANSDTQVTITVNRTGGSDGAVSVDAALGNGSSATAGSDFVFASPTTLSWADGDSAAKTFTITIKSDASVEATETIKLALTNANGGLAIGGTTSATVNIADADTTAPAVTLTAPAPGAKIVGSGVTFTGTATDNSGVARVEVVLNGAAPQIVTPASATANFQWSLPAVPEQGTNTVKVTAFDLQGNPSLDATRTFTFTNVRPALAGSYTGLLESANGVGNAINLNGLLSITVTPTGSFTGKLTLASGGYSVGGVFLTGGDARFGKALTPALEIVTKDGVSLGHLTLKIDLVAGAKGEHKVTGTLRDGPLVSANTLASIAHADQALYTAKKNPIAPFTAVPPEVFNAARENGKYTAIFQAVSAPNNTLTKTQFPQGDGWATVTVTNAGVAKLSGKLADGAIVSCSAPLSVANEWPLFAQAYAKKGFVIGNVKFDDQQTRTDAACIGARWFRPANAPANKLYTAGWQNGITVDFVASKFLPVKKPTAAIPNPPNSETVLGPGLPPAANTATVNIVAAVSDGGTTSTSNNASIDAKNKVTVLGATSGLTGATNLKISFTPTGAFSGSFTHSGSGKAQMFNGIVFQKTNSASGFFTYFPPATAVGAIPESGAVGVTKD